MKKLTLMFCLLLLGLLSAKAQDDATFTMQLPADTILMGNYFEVKFSLENASGQHFSPPTFEGFDIIGGPNQSSSFSMVNGVTSQQMAYSYYLQPKNIGNYYIETASIDADGVILETQPVEIIILPNPDGKKVDYGLREMRTFDLWGGFDQEIKPEKKDKPKKKKKKRKIYRM